MGTFNFCFKVKWLINWYYLGKTILLKMCEIKLFTYNYLNYYNLNHKIHSYFIQQCSSKRVTAI